MAAMDSSPEHKQRTKWIGTVTQALEHDDLESLRSLIDELHSSDSAHLIESIPPKERSLIWEIFDTKTRAEILPHLNDEVRSWLLEEMDSGEIAEAATNIETDDMADLLQDMSYSQTQKVLQSLDKQNRVRIEEALSYPEDSAGGLMNTDTIQIRGDIDLDVVLRYLRIHDKLPAGTDTLMVVDRDNSFLGTLAISTLLTGDLESSVESVMEKNCEIIPAEMSDKDVATLFERRDLISAPVLNKRGKLLGRITIDDVVDVIRDEADHSILGRAGLDEDEDMFAPVLVSVKRRSLWLGVNLATAFLASWVIGLFEHTMQEVIALAILMPVVASMGGIAGGQTLTLVIRGIALHQINDSNTRWLIFKESSIGVANGMIWAVVVGIVAWIWFDHLQLGIIISAAMMLNLTIAALSGAIIPIIQKRMGIDPALAGYVALTTVTDVVGFISFLGLATLFLL
jgi:magnesium transporter